MKLLPWIAIAIVVILVLVNTQSFDLGKSGIQLEAMVHMLMSSEFMFGAIVGLVIGLIIGVRLVTSR